MTKNAQGALPELPGMPPAVKPPGWIGHPGLFGTSRNGAWTHPLAPGVVVRHCGHPTALWPYYIEGLGTRQTFRTLAKAQAVVEATFEQQGVPA